jgi:hypothetical protein
MNSDRSLAAVVASALLGVIAAAAIVTAAFMFFGAWASQSIVSGAGRDLGAGAAILIGTLLLGFGTLAAIAARDEWRARAHARVLGMIVGILAILASATTMLTATVAELVPLLAIAIGLGAATIVAVVLDTLTQAPPGTMETQR